MMEDVNSSDSVVNRSLCTRRNALVAGVIVVTLCVIIIPIAVLVPGGSSNGNKALPPTDNSVLKVELINSYDRSDFHLLDKNQLDVKGSPQNRAFEWLRRFPKYNSLTHAKKLQKFALATFYYSTNGIKTAYSKDGPAWKNSRDWLSYDVGECDWHGLSCNDEDEITEISLNDNDLTGRFPPEMIWLTELEYIDVTTNKLYLEGPDALDVLGVFKKLHTLQADDNFIVTDGGLPESLGNLIELKKLVLSYNLLSGPLNNGVLENLSKLTHLEVESNFLTGEFPAVVGEWQDLIYLYMRRNALTMDLNWLKSGKMKNLFALWLDSNNIQGEIPSEIGQLTELASLSLTDAGLGGTLPSEVGNLTGLRRFWIYSNGIGGTIPKEIGNLKRLENFETHDNSFQGEMPEAICQVVKSIDYDKKSLTVDCKEVTCSTDTCCTECW